MNDIWSCESLAQAGGELTDEGLLLCWWWFRGVDLAEFLKRVSNTLKSDGGASRAIADMERKRAKKVSKKLGRIKGDYLPAVLQSQSFVCKTYPLSSLSSDQRRTWIVPGEKKCSFRCTIRNHEGGGSSISFKDHSCSRHCCDIPMHRLPLAKDCTEEIVNFLRLGVASTKIVEMVRGDLNSHQNRTFNPYILPRAEQWWAKRTLREKLERVVGIRLLV